MPLTPNSVLGRYQIRSLLGKGGMGEVYLAEDTNLKRRVAIKLLPDDLVEAPLRLRRFEREAYAASSLNHPNILTIFEIGEADGHHFIASEYVEGENLRQHMARRSMSLKQIVDTTVQVASALYAAECEGIVHRDIKPENIMIRKDGYVKVLDFGLAKLVNKATDEHWGDSNREALTVSMTSTSPGMILGTVAYMSPEQARGKDLDARSDIWSLGVVLYEMVTGKMPFKGETSSDLVAAILKTDPAPLPRFSPGAPPDLNDIVTKMLCKDQAGRYQSSKDVLADLENLKHELEFADKRGLTQPQALPKEDIPGNGRHLGPKGRLTNEKSITQHISRFDQLTSGIKRHKLGFTLMLAAFAIPLAAVGYFRTLPASSANINSLAVLPFVNESGNRDLDYLSDGLSENLRDHLSQLPELRVTARSSSSRFEGPNADPQEVATALGVQSLVVGRVVQRGDGLQVRVELIDGRDKTQIWGEEFNGSVAEIQKLQNEISRKVGAKLRPQSSSGDQPQISSKSEEEAYQLYLKGRYSWNKLTEEEWKKSIDYFNQALAKNPNYALAYSGLANSHLTLGANDLSPQETYPKAKGFARRALQVDDSLAEAHYAMAASNYYYDWDLPGAEKELSRTLELNPNYTMAHALRSSIFLSRGQTDAAIVQLKRALELDPFSLLLNSRLSAAYYLARDYNRALEQMKKTLELDPEATFVHSDICMVYAQMSRFEEALASCQKGIILKKDDPAPLAALGITYALWGKKNETEWILSNLKELGKKKYIQPYDLACIYAALGNKAQALALLEKAHRERSFMMYFRIDPVFDKVRSDPRYTALIQSIDSRQ